MMKSRTEDKLEAEDPRRDLQLAPIRMRPWTLPDQLPPEAAHYFLDDWPTLLNGLTFCTQALEPYNFGHGHNYMQIFK